MEINPLNYFLWLLCVLAAIAEPESSQTELVEGDMILPATRLFKRSGIRSKDQRWKHGVIPYTLSSDYTPSQVKLILGGMKEISFKTCVQFKPKGEQDEDYVAIVTGDGCSSNIGKKGGKQLITLNSDRNSHCMTHGTVVHELVHALGFIHEHERTDRDKFIRILKDNIHPEVHDQFNKYNRLEVHDFNLPYDYASIMHYNELAGRKEKNLKTIVAHKAGVSIGQRDGLSKQDVLKIKRMYCPKAEVEEVNNLHSFGLSPWEIGFLFERKYGTWSPTSGIRETLNMTSSVEKENRMEFEILWTKKLIEKLYASAKQKYHRISNSQKDILTQKIS